MGRGKEPRDDGWIMQRISIIMTDNYNDYDNVNNKVYDNNDSNVY